jgi:hypothetical protein
MNTYRFENRNSLNEFCFSCNYPLNETQEKDIEANSKEFIEYCKKENRLIPNADQVFMVCNETNEETKIF